MTGKIALPLTAFVLLLAATAAPAQEADARPSRQTAERFAATINGEEAALNYLLYVPKREGDRRLPVLVFLHGSGESGDDLELVKRHGPPKLIDTGQKWNFITISPQVPAEGRGGWAPFVDLLPLLVDDVIARHHGNPRRVYLTGLSLGGSGTWDAAAAHPDKWAAIAPICGPADLETAAKIKAIPTWGFVGLKDSESTVEGMKAMNEALKAAGGKPRLTTYPELGHDCWTLTYENAEFYQWLRRQRLPNRRAAGDAVN